MRLVHFAGFVGSGKTSVIHSLSEDHEFCFIANNKESADELKDVCPHVDDFPFKSPCARIRQYRFRFDMMLENDPKVIITEPPGNCLDVSSPMLNPIYVKDRDKIELGPLITVFSGRDLLSKGISKRTTDGLRAYNMIDESDVIILTFSDGLSEDEKNSLVSEISSINEDAKIIFFSKDSIKEISEAVFGNMTYRRPLVY